MGRKPKATKARIRVALAKGQELARRMKDLETCLSIDLRVALAAALADDYAALMEEYPDVFPAPPIPSDQVRADAKGLRDAQAAFEENEAESRVTTRELHVALNELTRPPEKPEKPS